MFELSVLFLNSWTTTCTLFLNLKSIYAGALNNCVLFKNIFALCIVLLISLLGLPLQLNLAFMYRLLHHISKHFWEKLKAACNFAVSLPFHRITESQNSRGWKGPLWVIKSNPPAEAGSPTAGCTGPCPGRFWISPEKETPQPPWAACSSAPSPSERRSSSSCSDSPEVLFD